MARVVGVGAPGLSAPRFDLSNLGGGLSSIADLIKEREREEQSSEFRRQLMQGLSGGPAGPSGAPSAPQLGFQDAFAKAFEAVGDPGIGMDKVLEILQPGKPQVVGARERLVGPGGEVIVPAEPVVPKLSDFKEKLILAGYKPGTPEFIKAARALINARKGNPSEFENLLRTMADGSEKSALIKARLNSIAGLDKSEMTSLMKEVAAATGSKPGDAKFQTELTKRLDARDAASDPTFKKLMELLPPEQEDEFLQEMRLKITELTGEDEPKSSFVDEKGNLKPSVSKAIQALAVPLFEGFFDEKGQIRFLDPDSPAKFARVIEAAEGFLLTGQEKNAQGAVNRAAQEQGTIPAVVAPTPAGGTVTPPPAAVPAGPVVPLQALQGSGTKEDPFVGAPELILKLPKGAFFRDARGLLRQKAVEPSE